MSVSQKLKERLQWALSTTEEVNEMVNLLSGGGGTVTAVTASSPVASSGGATPNITIQSASGSQAGSLSSTDWNTFNNKQAGPLAGDVTTVGTTATLTNFINRVYVDFLNGSDSSGTGSPIRPWKTLQHAYNSISPSINEPYTIHLSGGNNDTDTGTITGKPNVNLFSDYLIDLTANLTISGGTTNDTCSFQNIVFKALTWVRNDISEIELQLVNCTASGLIDFEQQGSGATGSFMQVQGGGCTGGLTIRAGQLNYQAPAFYGTVTFKDVGTQYFALITAADLYTTAFTLNGPAYIYFYGDTPDSGYSITGVTTANGSPTVQADAGSLPSTISGPVSLVLNTLSKYVSYTATTATDWNGTPPTTVVSALDRCAAALNALGHKP